MQATPPCYGVVNGHVMPRAPRVRHPQPESSPPCNGFEQRLTVVPLGLSDRARSATFHTSANSELKSLHASGTSSETVALEALDDYLAQHLPGQRIDFVKLDAEGEEPQVLTGGRRFFDAQSPIVMFELQHGGSINLPLIEAFRSHGFDVFRHHPELELLVAFDDRAEELQFVLNLFAIKPDRQAALAAQNLLMRAGDLAAASDQAPASQPAKGAGALVGQEPRHKRSAPERSDHFRGAARLQGRSQLQRNQTAARQAQTAV